LFVEFGQTVLTPVIKHVGLALTVNVALQLVVQPFASVTVTVYVLLLFAVMLGVVAPVFHK
jgi:hypothetical protein